MDEASESLLGATRDVSTAGVFVERVSARVSSRVTLRVQDKKTLEPFALAGTVRRVSREGIGVELDELRAAIKKRLLAFVAKSTAPGTSKRVLLDVGEYLDGGRRWILPSR